MAQKRLRRVFSFPLDDHLREALKAIRDETGVPVAYQIRRGIALWLESQGRPVEQPGKRPAAARARKATKRRG